MGYLPEVYHQFKQSFPGVAMGYDDLAASCHQWGPLDARPRRLVKLGIAIGLCSEVGVRSLFDERSKRVYRQRSAAMLY